jgi:ATP/maltotriose-dependent transcriptional regulator MalT/DNA-binding SARP family transcriptional activator
MNLTKFLRPQPSHVLTRERLLQKIASWDDKKLVLILAQAGQGKSTLASEYIGSVRFPSVWYNLDREDGNPSVFLTSLGQALNNVLARTGAGETPVFINRFGFGRLQDEISRWIQDVFGHVAGPCLIVLDDYHEAIGSTELRFILKMLLELTPPHIRFFLISRTRPDIELAKLRASQSIGEITGTDLKFSDGETHELFNTVYGLALPEKEAAAINRMTEGWPAGLVLTHEYLANVSEEERTTALHDDRGDGFRSHIFDYLAQEVFSALPRDLQRFLLRTSIVDHLPIQLIGALLESANRRKQEDDAARSYIQDLRRRNLFVTIIDPASSVIRYHALFREFLQRKLIMQTDPTEVRKLYSTAARYFRTQGDTVRMVDLLISSGQFDPAVRMIESTGLELISRGQVQTLLRWIQALPLDCGSRPWFLLYRAIAFRFAEPRSAVEFFDMALAGFRRARSIPNGILGRMLSLCGIIEASFYAGGNFKRMERAAAEAASLLKRHRRSSPAVMARLSLAIGTAFFFIGRLREGSAHLQQALDLFRKVDDHFYQIQSAIYLAPCSIYHADFARARSAIKLGVEALRSIPHETGGEAALHMAQAMTALFEGDLKEAEESINRCYSLAHKHDLEAFNFLSLDIGGWIKTAKGDHAAAEKLLRQCRSKGEEHGNAFFSASSAHLLAVNYLHQDRIDEAENEANYALAIRERSGSTLFFAVSLSVSGLIDVKRGRLARGERRLLAARRLARQCEAHQLEANILLALAELYLVRKKEKQVAASLDEGLRLGEERQFMHYYLFSRSGLARLLREALQRGIRSRFCERLQDSLGMTDGSARVSIACLGGFKVWLAEEPVKDAAWKGKQAKALLKLLLSDPGRKVSREVIMEALWGNSAVDTQRANLASLVYRIRKVLDGPKKDGDGGSCVILDGDHLSLDPSRVVVDVERFLSSLEKAERFKAQNEHGACVEEYERAIDLYRGDFIPEDLYEDWIVAARDRLRLRYFKALLNMARIAESSSDAGRAVAAYSRLFDADECNEEACRWLMSHFHTTGQRGAAVRTYERCQLALQRTLEAEPEAETSRLYRNMIGG